ncbi:hypothetical protein KFU94_30765 [Chloroflexi bacterium TSY]|nr:hypothetical protein [Chloroflexi bacterium TSY]
MRERGNLERDDDGCWIVGDKLDWDILPERVEATIGTRIARLSPELCDLLTVASVEGEVFTAEVVARVQQIDVRQAIHTFSSVLDKQYDLVRMENIRNIGNRRIVQYRFHILFQRYLYGLLDIAQQNVFHNDVALSLESLYNGLNEDWDQIATQLAYHFEKATEYQKSAQYLRIVGEHSLRLSAVSEAIAQLTKGLRFWLGRYGDESKVRAQIAVVVEHCLFVFTRI